MVWWTICAASIALAGTGAIAAVKGFADGVAVMIV